MKKFLIFFVFILVLPIVNARTTKASKFAEAQYAQENCPAHINVKKEHTNECLLNIEGQAFSAFIYGWGDVKIKGCKKYRVSYIVLLDCNRMPIWSSLYSSLQ